MSEQHPLGRSTTTVTERLIAGYTAEIAARRRQLCADLLLYRRRLIDLAELDAQDLTGLTRLYRAHESQIEVLLKEFDRHDDPS